MVVVCVCASCMRVPCVCALLFAAVDQWKTSRQQEGEVVVAAEEEEEATVVEVTVEEEAEEEVLECSTPHHTTAHMS